MRLLRHLLFALNSAWQSFWRNAGVSVAAVVSITLILVLAGVNLLVGHALAGVLDTYKTRVSAISVAVADQTPLATVYQFKQQLEADPRGQEIEVMKLVGATAWFVRGPFVIEGVMTGVLAASLALGLLVGVYRPFVERFRADLFFIPLSYDPRFVSTLGQDLFLGGAL